MLTLLLYYKRFMSMKGKLENKFMLWKISDHNVIKRVYSRKVQKNNENFFLQIHNYLVKPKKPFK